MNIPAVSVLVPVFNDAEHLGPALESIRRQCMQDFEVIVCDDASTDGSRSVASEFCGLDERFRLIENAENLGMTRNWNRALGFAIGRYVVKLDSDDAFEPQALAQLKAAMESDANPIAAYCRSLDCGPDLKPFSSYLGERAMVRAGIEPLAAHCRRGGAWYQLCFDDMQLWHSNAQMHRREALQAMGGWDEALGCASDTDLILRVLERDEPVCHVPYAGVLYRHRPGSVSGQYRANAWLRWESAIVHLASLSRYHRAGHKLGGRLRKAWWRYWRNWRKLQAAGTADLDSLRADARTRLLHQAALVQGPPASVLAEGALRQMAWNLAHARRG